MSEGIIEHKVPKTRRGRRKVESRSPKVVENVKQALFLHGTSTSQIVKDGLRSLYALKKPDAVKYARKNDVRPFEDVASLEFFSDRNDTSLFAFGSHSKKRPHNLVLGRFFNHQILDMFELGIQKFDEPGVSRVSTDVTREVKVKGSAIGAKPCFVFEGDLFENNVALKELKNIFLDFFRGQIVDSVNLAGMDHVIVCTAVREDLVLFRHYMISLWRSGSKKPRVELDNVGPNFDFQVRRFKLASPDTMKDALKIPRELLIRKRKNLEQGDLGETLGRVHLGRQDLSGMVLSRVKGLNKRRRVSSHVYEESKGAGGDEGGNEDESAVQSDDE